LLLASLLPLAAASAAVATIDVRRTDGSYTVHASAPVTADARTAFETLTDYDRLREFVPDIETSRVVAREGNRLTVEQVGAFRLLFFSMPVRVRLAVEHQPYERVLARSTSGLVGGEVATLRSFAGEYAIRRLAAPVHGVRIDYDARFELAEGFGGFVDSAFGRALVSHGLRRHFEAMLNEIERRHASAAAERAPRR
jgi:hypothetical protein